MLVIRKALTKWRRRQLYLWLKYSIRNKSMTFFSVVNPRIETGGMFGERKTDIYDILDPNYIPTTFLFKSSLDQLSSEINKHGLGFPLIVKPNTGLGGTGVYKADTLEELKYFLSNIPNEELIIQEFITYKREFSILYYCLPKSHKTIAYSIIEKVYPIITGDGISTIKELIENLGNDRLRKDYIYKKLGKRLQEILPEGEEMVVDYMGNYVSGAEFLYHNVEIPDSLGQQIHDAITKTADIYFARLDVKADTVPELLKGKFLIIEVNGTKSEPLELYTPNVPEDHKHQTLNYHWEMLERISHEQMALGETPTSTFEALKSMFHLNKSLSTAKMKKG